MEKSGEFWDWGIYLRSPLDNGNWMILYWILYSCTIWRLFIWTSPLDGLGITVKIEKKFFLRGCQDVQVCSSPLLEQRQLQNNTLDTSYKTVIGIVTMTPHVRLLVGRSVCFLKGAGSTTFMLLSEHLFFKNLIVFSQNQNSGTNVPFMSWSCIESNQ